MEERLEMFKTIRKLKNKKARGILSFSLCYSILLLINFGSNLSGSVQSKAMESGLTLEQKRLIEAKRVPSYDLSVEDIFIDQETCELHVILKNYGTVIPESIFTEGKFKINSALFPNINPWPIRDVDPRKELNSRKQIDFNTKIVIKSKENVEVYLINVNDKNTSNNRKLKFLTPSAKCLEQRETEKALFLITSPSTTTSLKSGQKQTSDAKKTSPSQQMELDPNRFLEPARNAIIPFKSTKYNSLAICWSIPDQYTGQHLKAIFYFVDSRGSKWYPINYNRNDYPYWLDRLGDLPPTHYDSAKQVLTVFHDYAGPVTRVKPALNDNLNFQDLPVGQYFVKADLTDARGMIIASYSSSFTISEQTIPIEQGSVQPRDRNWGTVESMPLVVESLKIVDWDYFETRGYNIKLAIEGKTKDWKPVRDYCGERVCGGEIKVLITSLTPGTTFGKVHETSYPLPSGRLKLAPRNPARFGTMDDPLRITLNTEVPDIRLDITIALDKAEKKTFTYSLIRPGGGNIVVDKVYSEGEEHYNYKLNITSPQENEILIAGQTKTIQWETPQETRGTKRITYSTDNGQSWKRIGETQGNRFEWSVPYEFTERGKLKIEWYGDMPPEKGGPIINIKIKNIKIRGIKLISPRGAEILRRGSTHTITWTASGSGGNVKLYWGEQRINTLIGCVPNTGRFNWQVPDSFSPRAFMRIEWVSSCSGGTINGEDKSEGFSITNPRVEILSPKGAESFASGSTISLSWNAIATEGVSLTGQISLYYSLDNGRTWNEIASNLPLIGNYRWIAPSVNQDTSSIIRAVWTHYHGDVRETFTGQSLPFTIKR